MVAERRADLMTGNILSYKGYKARVEVDFIDRILYGKIEGINDLVTFESESIEEIEKEFRLAVDDYLEFCKEEGVEPDKPYSGSFNVRVTPELHKKVAQKAFDMNVSLNSLVSKALEKLFEPLQQNLFYVNYSTPSVQMPAIVQMSPDIGGFPDKFDMMTWFN